MDFQQYEKLSEFRNTERPVMIAYKDAQFFIDSKEGTLLWGYTCERYSFHVYLKDNKIHRLIYNKTENKILDYICGDELKAEDLYPDKRTYPEATSYDFMMALLKAGQEPSVTRFDDNREFAHWYGKTREDFKGSSNIVFKDLK